MNLFSSISLFEKEGGGFEKEDDGCVRQKMKGCFFDWLVYLVVRFLLKRHSSIIRVADVRALKHCR